MDSLIDALLFVIVLAVLSTKLSKIAEAIDRLVDVEILKLEKKDSDKNT